MNRAEAVPLGRLIKFLPRLGTWYGPGYQGPAGLYAIRGTGAAEALPMFQVCKVERRWVNLGDTKELTVTENVSEPWMTYEGADQFAQRLAGGCDSRIG